MDEARDMLNDEKEKRRALVEKARWDEDRQKEREVAEQRIERIKADHLDNLRQQKVDAMHRATSQRDQARREKLRLQRIEEIEEKRMRRFRERQYMEQAKAAAAPKFGEAADDAEDADAAMQ